MTATIILPPTWIGAQAFEEPLQACKPHETSTFEIRILFSSGCKIMIDAAVRLLSLCNQLDSCCRCVTLDFEEGEEGAMGYLNRMGFFDHLSTRICVKPKRPDFSGAELYRGGSRRLVEIAKINRQYRDVALPTKLTEALMLACGKRSDAEELGGAAWTIFAELIDNIFSHSETRLDGYAALQVYPGGNSLKVAVSDSGLGIMETLKPTLVSESPTLVGLSDLDLLVEIFRQGLSRHGTDRGCGLKGSAEKAMKYNAELDVRLPNMRVVLMPSDDEYTMAYGYEKLPLLWGTHICFTFSLDSR